MFSTAKVNALAPTTGTGNEKRRTLRKSANLRAEPPFIFFLIEEDKRMLCLINPLKLPRPERLDQLIWFFSHQAGFLCATIHLYLHNRARCTKQTDIRPGFDAVSQQHPTHAQQKSQSIHAESTSSTPKSFKKRKALLPGCNGTKKKPHC